MINKEEDDRSKGIKVTEATILISDHGIYLDSVLDALAFALNHRYDKFTLIREYQDKKEIICNMTRSELFSLIDDRRKI